MLTVAAGVGLEWGFPLMSGFVTPWLLLEIVFGGYLTTQIILRSALENHFNFLQTGPCLIILKLWFVLLILAHVVLIQKVAAIFCFAKL